MPSWPLPFLAPTGPASDSPSLPALDIAAGDGRRAVALAKLGYRVTTVDYSIVAARLGRDRAAREGVELRTVVADLDDFDLGRERWSVITSFRYLNRRLFGPLIAALRPGGLIVYETFTDEQARLDARTGPRSERFLLRRGELLEAFRALRVRYYEERVFTAEESGTGDRASLARLVAECPPHGHG